MPVLLLAQGDPKAKDLLRRAIEARYGPRPPALDTLHVFLKGQIPGRIGPIPAGLSISADVFFRFPTAMNGSWQVKRLGVTTQRAASTLDGKVYRPRAGSPPTNDLSLVTSAQTQLWLVSALLLMPLGDQNTKLSLTGDHSLEATNVKTNISAVLQLRPDFSLDSVQARCVNSASGQEQMLTLGASNSLTSMNDLNIPGSISVLWDDKVAAVLTPIGVETNPTLAPDFFA